MNIKNPDNPRTEKDYFVPIPRWYWVISIIATLWNLFAANVFLMELFYKEEMLVGFTETQKEWSRSFGIWTYVIWGVAVISAISGSIGLLLRKRISRQLLDMSLAAVITLMSYTMLIAGGLKVMGPTGAIMPSLIIVVAIGLVWFVRYVNRREWLRD